MNRILGAGMIILLGSALSAFSQDKPTDPQIAHIAYTAGEIDIEAARLALSKSGTEAVTGFAQSMLDDHQAVNEQALELVKKLGVTPEDNTTSQSLLKGAEEKQAELAKLDGAAFDKAYVDNEIAFHAQVNEALETLLIPSAENEELKGLLETGLKLFQGHQQHAEQVKEELQ